ncbi:hypothetical protein PJI17_27615 [Mycobacterium kansasii]
MTIRPEAAVAVAAADCGIGLNGESPQRRRPAPRGGERETAQRARGIASRIPSDPRGPEFAVWQPVCDQAGSSIKQMPQLHRRRDHGG